MKRPKTPRDRNDPKPTPRKPKLRPKLNPERPKTRPGKINPQDGAKNAGIFTGAGDMHKVPNVKFRTLRPGIGLDLPGQNGKKSLFENLSTDVPLTLLPVRLETVFDREQERLWLKIRVYPDEIHTDNHDPRLSPDEKLGGLRFWGLLKEANGDETLEEAAKSWLIDTFSEKRATFVAEATREGAVKVPVNKNAGNRPSQARCLPRYWNAVAFRRRKDGTLAKAFNVKGGAIPTALCIDPVLGETASATSPAGRTVLWMSDFDAALRVGMAMKVDVTDLDWLDKDGIALLMVYGVKGAASSAQSNALQTLLTAHRYASGLAFQAQGVPTNSVEDIRSPVASHFAAPDGTLSTVFEDAVTAKDSNAGQIARALGLDVGPVLSRLEGAERDEQSGQRWMNEALWPVTWGQYFNELMKNRLGEITVPEGAVEMARQTFINDVRGGGPLPALRVGSQPYGVLPVRAHHVPRTWANTDPWYEYLMLALRDIWLDATPNVAKLSPSGNGSRDEALPEVVRVLGSVPHPARFLVRKLENWRYQADTNPWLDFGLTLIGLFWLTVDDPSFGREAQSIVGQWGWARAMLGDGWSEGDLTAPGAGFSASTIDSLDNDDVSSPEQQKQQLENLRRQLRFSGMTSKQRKNAGLWIDHMLRQIDGHAGRLDPYLGSLPIKFMTDVDGVLRNRSLDPKIAYHLYDKSAREFTRRLVVGMPEAADEGDVNAALSILPQHYLKVAAGRLAPDPLVKGGKAADKGKSGISTMATSKKSQAHVKPQVASNIAARSAPIASVQQPVFQERIPNENVNGDPQAQPKPQRSAEEPMLKQLVDAAVKSAKSGERNALKHALNRLADLPASTLEWHMRETLGLATNRLDAWLTVLATRRLRETEGPANEKSKAQYGGYGFVLDLKPGPASESDGFLHAPTMALASTGAILRSAWLGHGRDDANSPLAINLTSGRLRMADRLFEGVSQGREVGEILGHDIERALHDARQDVALYPLRQAVLAAKKAEDQTVRGPVDGLDLLEVFDQGKLDDHLAAITPLARRQAVKAAIKGARDSFDALADAGLAEAVHYISQGNMPRANAVLNALSRGEAPPSELRHARTDISKSELSHMVLLTLPDLLQRAAKDIPAGRILTHPGLNAYVEKLLPDLMGTGVDVVSGDTVHHVPIADLDLTPIDLVCEAGRPGALGRFAIANLLMKGVGILPDARALTALGAETTTGSRVAPNLEELEELAVQLSAHLGALRQARPADFNLPETKDRDIVHIAALQTCLKSVAERLNTRAAALESTDLFDQAALVEVLRLVALEGLPDALVDLNILLAENKDALKIHVRRVYQTLKTRSIQAKQAAQRTEPADMIAALSALGDGHLAPEIPFQQVKLPRGASLGFKPPAASALLNWAGQYAHVRDNIRRWRTAMDTAALLSVKSSWPLTVSQITAQPEKDWLGHYLPKTGTAGGVSFVAVDAGGWSRLAKGLTAVVYVIDGWTERLPALETTSGVAFHFDAPSSRPPQSVLVAVTPNSESGWSEDLLQRTLIETVENVQLRAVTSDALGQFGHHLPAIFVPGGINAGTQPAPPADDEKDSK